ncbi:radical SAM protein [uncultured Cohaesibacter sp.]|uniref:B12-binding domain-containing radical SAM protein n=1 Tax=uncultured Cohaesibacter sp. TaxID=1002546 RepID=UPI0029C872E7|nr:radical SAM protein [uncultured Cohaesibacter sp.]
MIKPTHYDDDGYPIQWLRSAIPSNTLATLNGLAVAAVDAQALGPDIDVRLHTYDETNRRIRPENIIAKIRKDGGKALIGFVGVQSNQFPRAVDLARIFRSAGLPVCIGGFHVSGCIAMLDVMPPELVEAQKMGISFFAGEAEEGRLDVVLRDAFNDELKPLYNFMNDLPGLIEQPTPILPPRHIGRTAGAHTSFDLGRGCPYQCSFCTIINVQGRKSRYRSADDLETIIRENYAQGINRFFITDDNFARNRAWESMFDRLIELRERDHLDIKFIIQVDTLCHKIDGFINKATRAGVNRVFIGLENINPDNLMAAKKKQNKITEYRDMLQAWRRHGATTYAGYIIGFPGDSKESILRDIEIIKRELPLDLLEFFYLTPLPGSEDHKVMISEGKWTDPDLNKYDLNHRVSAHPCMSDQEWDEAYQAAWNAYYTPGHMRTILRRAAAHKRGRPGNKLFLMCWFYFMLKFEGIHPLEGGYFRLKFRKDRRPGLPRQTMLGFYLGYGAEIVSKHVRYGLALASVLPSYWRIKKNPKRYDYSDLAIVEQGDTEGVMFEMFSKTRGGVAEVERLRRQRALIDSARAGG